MSEDEPWIINTQNTLGTYVKNPKLTGKLLSRPPFRFLHDVVTAFMKGTNLLNGLYSADEMDPVKAGTDKETKLRYLDKLITCIQYATGDSLPTKAANIIAGKEPQETNLMLSKLAAVAKASPAAVNDAVNKITGGGAAASTAGASGAPPQSREADSRGSLRNQQTPAENNDRRSKKAAAADDAPDKPAEPQGSATAANKAPAIQRPGTASARKPPPQLRSNEVVEDRSAIEAAAPVTGVIVERKGDDDDEDGSAAASRRKKDGANPESQQDWMKLVEQHENATSATRQSLGDGAPKGYLANEALQAKKDQEEAARRAKQEAAGMRQEGVVLSYKGKAGDQGGVVGDGEISKLREQLQLLTKASNPLGKYLEAIFDDIDSMTRELDMWRNEARTQTSAANEAQRQTHESLREVNSQIGSLEEGVKDQLQKVSVVRAQIQKNEATIEKLIRMVINPNENKK